MDVRILSRHDKPIQDPLVFVPLIYNYVIEYGYIPEPPLIRLTASQGAMLFGIPNSAAMLALLSLALQFHCVPD